MTLRRRFAVASTLVAAAVLLATALPQLLRSTRPTEDPGLVPDAPSCSACSIESKVVAVLGTPEGPAALGEVFRVRTDSRARYWVFSRSFMPKLFDRQGRFVRAVGAPGQGPGELQGPVDMWQLPGDSVVIQEAAASLHLFDPDLAYVRTLRNPLLGVADHVVLAWPGSVVVNALDPHPERFGQPLHLVDFSGPAPEVLRSFGWTGEAITSSSMYYRMPRAMAPARSGGYWVAAKDRYTLTRRTEAGDEQLRLGRRPDWFAEASEMGGGGPETPPDPRCDGVSEDEAGLLWSFCRLPSARWREAYGGAAGQSARPETGGTAEAPAGDVDRRLLYHTSLEVIDPDARRVVARTTLEEPVTSVLPGREAAVVRYSPLGVPSVRVLRFSLHGYPP